MLRTSGTYSAGWSSLVARRAHNPEVVGSNPAPATKFVKARQKCLAFFVFTERFGVTSLEMENIIEEVEHGLAVEHMTMTETEKENLRRVGRGELTYSELIKIYVTDAKRLAASHD